jgi:hypothetical protein
MKSSRIAIITICLCWLGGSTVLTNNTAEAATTFSGAVVGIDDDQRTITFQTMDGQTWTLPVADPNVLKHEQVAKGDQVSIEIDLSERITKITKVSTQHRSKPTTSLDDIRP